MTELQYIHNFVLFFLILALRQQTTCVMIDKLICSTIVTIVLSMVCVWCVHVSVYIDARSLLSE